MEGRVKVSASLVYTNTCIMRVWLAVLSRGFMASKVAVRLAEQHTNTVKQYYNEAEWRGRASEREREGDH